MKLTLLLPLLITSILAHDEPIDTPDDAPSTSWITDIVTETTTTTICPEDCTYTGASESTTSLAERATSLTESTASLTESTASLTDTNTTPVYPDRTTSSETSSDSQEFEDVVWITETRFTTVTVTPTTITELTVTSTLGSDPLEEITTIPLEDLLVSITDTTTSKFGAANTTSTLLSNNSFGEFAQNSTTGGMLAKPGEKPYIDGFWKNKKHASIVEGEKKYNGSTGVNTTSYPKVANFVRRHLPGHVHGHTHTHTHAHSTPLPAPLIPRGRRDETAATGPRWDWWQQSYSEDVASEGKRRFFFPCEIWVGIAAVVLAVWMCFKCISYVRLDTNRRRPARPFHEVLERVERNEVNDETIPRTYSGDLEKEGPL
ncbi:hypothetical protein EJ08DRAFT_691832 [Tothia fuscella]|uniref:Uncharacterized protein n=1 Tax=Tothia fuscella TaxID=1048955 RepID=A0A9P4U472_9PEZI|nr:hypothetical protein EJ08DRAFT_691832 [Tothia fuscella]